ncbi:MAG: hypothetical protein HC880_04235, partial [Bacteroidia bacterium]|nr:hypothetical protein [Bacteroidia bacterium]
IPRLFFRTKLIHARYGSDTPGSNWGQNVFLNNSDFERELGNNIGQGVSTRLSLVDFTASFQIRHNVFIDFSQIFRRLDSALDERDRNTSYTSVAFRWNIPRRAYTF